LLVVAAIAVGTGLAATAATLRWPGATPIDPGLARAVGREEAARHPALRDHLRRRTDPSRLTGLVLTAAVAVLTVSGLAIGVLVAVIRRSLNGPLGWDSAAAHWAATNATGASTRVLRELTQFGGSTVLIPLCIGVAIIETVRHRTAAVAGFVVLAFGGELVVTNLVKVLVGRTRPDIDRLTGFHGVSQSFPSGHAANAAAAFAALALLLGRRHSCRVKAVLAGLAVGLAAAIAASRVLLGVHWLTDVTAGLLLGWGWFSLSAIAFGGSLLRFGEPVKAAEHEVAKADHALPT
jgi:undecaprenyl-diphosphatase